MESVVDLVSRNKLKNSSIEHFYRYGCYFYLFGFILMNNVKNQEASKILHKCELLLSDIIDDNDEILVNIRKLKKKTKNKF